MLYLANFKRRYEKWLNSQPENKEVNIPQLKTKNTNRTVGEIKKIIQNARQSNLKKSRNKTTKSYIESKARLKKYTGGEVINNNPRINNPPEYFDKFGNRNKFTEKPNIKKRFKISPTNGKLRKNIVTTQPETEISQIVKPIINTTTDLKPSQISENNIKATSNNIQKKIMAEKIGRKNSKLGIIGTGLLIATGAGITLGANKLRKSRKDKGQKRRKYKK